MGYTTPLTEEAPSNAEKDRGVSVFGATCVLPLEASRDLQHHAWRAPRQGVPRTHHVWRAPRQGVPRTICRSSEEEEEAPACCPTRGPPEMLFDPESCCAPR
ncbi:unnamed protein product [Prorocentrum cordatum]|uniref:Uncharacterized protein n=1 Tax=Prorocentrum cordatum TaxID=2364126 RepID=A0ABN9RSV6_9DINO|nr:unnamed protein product [Polarella glacialis]